MKRKPKLTLLLCHIQYAARRLHDAQKRQQGYRYETNDHTIAIQIEPRLIVSYLLYTLITSVTNLSF
jgi:hypothetical protein